VLCTACVIIVYYYNGAQWYEQFLQVGRLDRASILSGLVLYLLNVSVSLVFVVIYVLNCFYILCCTFYWPFTWLTNHCPSVL